MQKSSSGRMKWVYLAGIIVLMTSLPRVNAGAQCTPVASYPFNGNAEDISGNNNHGILGGETQPPILVADRFGNPGSAYSFGGYFNKNWIRIPNSPTLQFSDKMSVSLWFRQCTFEGMDGGGEFGPNGYFITMSKAGDGIGANPGIWMFTHTDADGRLRIQFSNKNGTDPASTNFVQDTTMDCFEKCEWVHAVVVINGTSWKIYLNGQLRKQAIIEQPDFTAANSQDFYIGRMFGSAIIWYPFNGIMDDINIYNCALGQTEVESLFNGYRDPLAGNNSIEIDSIRIRQPGCATGEGGTLWAFPHPAGAPYQYSIDGGITFQSSGIFSNLLPGSWKLRIKSECTYRDTLIKIDKPATLLETTVFICSGQTYFTGGAWQSREGIYYDTVRTSLTCDTIKKTTLRIATATETVINQSICAGRTFAGYSLPGTYRDTLKTANGACDSIRVLNLTVHRPPRPDLGRDRSICTGDTILLFPGNFSTYRWQDNSVSDRFKVTQPGRYTVTVTNSCGMAAEEILIREENNCTEYFPTAFTPDADGRNDQFKILSAAHLYQFTLEIYNRSGQKIFTSTDYLNGWDGNWKGIPQPPGIYIYRSTFKKNGKTRSAKGTLVLIR